MAKQISYNFFINSNATFTVVGGGAVINAIFINDIFTPGSFSGITLNFVDSTLATSLMQIGLFAGNSSPINLSDLCVPTTSAGGISIISSGFPGGATASVDGTIFFTVP